MKYVVSFIGNFIWKVFGGVWLAIIWFAIGIALSLTIVGYPLAIGCFKIAWLSFKPTNKRVAVYFDKYLIVNIVWAVCVGWLVIPYAIVGVLLNIFSIFGLPLIAQWYKIVKVCLFPFGSIIK